MSAAVEKPLETTFRERLVQARAAILVYWALAAGGQIFFTVAILAYDSGGADTAFNLSLLAFGTFVGVAVGQLLALFRLRTWVSWVVSGTSFVIFIFAIGAGLGPELGLPWIGFTFGLLGGHASLAHRFGLAASWLPICYWVGTIIVILNAEGRVDEWEQEKTSIWLPVPLLVLFLLVVLLLAYMAVKETHRLSLWQQIGSAPSKLVRIRREAPRLRLRGRGWATIVVLGLLVFGVTAVVAPYLWRTGPGDGNGDNGGDPDEPAPPDEPDDWGQDQVDWEAVKRAFERAKDAARDGAGWMFPFIPLFLLNRPIRRAWLLFRLRRPPWPESPTRRIAGLWEYVRIALGDAGHLGKPSDTPAAQAERARAASRTSPAVADAAEIYTRARHGLGLPPGGVAAMQHAAVAAFRETRAPLTRWQRVKSWFRKLD